VREMRKIIRDCGHDSGSSGLGMKLFSPTSH